MAQRHVGAERDAESDYKSRDAAQEHAAGAAGQHRGRHGDGRTRHPPGARARPEAQGAQGQLVQFRRAARCRAGRHPLPQPPAGPAAGARLRPRVCLRPAAERGRRSAAEGAACRAGRLRRKVQRAASDRRGCVQQDGAGAGRPGTGSGRAGGDEGGRPAVTRMCSTTCRKEIPMTTRRLFWAPVAVLGALSLACDAGERSTAPSLSSPSLSLRAGPSPFYEQHNLVSDGAVPADLVDPALVNAWGLVASATSPWWVADNGTDSSTLYNGSTGAKLSLRVSVPSAPTGVVFNGGAGFVVTSGYASGAARFIFATEQGTILGWNPAVAATQAVED